MNKKYWVAFSAIDQLDSTFIQRLYNYFGDVETAFNATRKDLKKNAVFDAGVCHGASGIAHLFLRLYLETNNMLFFETAEYWYDKTLDFAKYNSGPAKYKRWIEREILVDDFSLLEGIIGIGLCIMSKLKPQLIDWDECILLS